MPPKRKLETASDGKSSTQSATPSNLERCKNVAQHIATFLSTQDILHLVLSCATLFKWLGKDCLQTHCWFAAKAGMKHETFIRKLFFVFHVLKDCQSWKSQCENWMFKQVATLKIDFQNHVWIQHVADHFHSNIVQKMAKKFENLKELIVYSDMRLCLCQLDTCLSLQTIVVSGNLIKVSSLPPNIVEIRCACYALLLFDVELQSRSLRIIKTDGSLGFYDDAQMQNNLPPENHWKTFFTNFPNLECLEAGPYNDKDFCCPVYSIHDHIATVKQHGAAFRCHQMPKTLTSFFVSSFFASNVRGGIYDQVISLRFCKVPDLFSEYATFFPNLEKLQIDRAPISLAHFPLFPKLKFLSLCGVDGLHQPLDQATFPPCLHTLILPGFTDSLQQLAKRLPPNLTHLSLPNYFHAVELDSFPHTLQILDLSECKHIFCNHPNHALPRLLSVNRSFAEVLRSIGRDTQDLVLF